MKKITKLVFGLLIFTMTISAFAFSVNVGLAAGEDALGGLEEVRVTAIELAEGGDLKATIGNIIQFFLGFLGILAIILILYAGFLWMTAGGDSAKVDKAKDYIKNAVIGIVIILAAYIITTFIIEEIGTQLV